MQQIQGRTGLASPRKKNKVYSMEALWKKQQTFGSIVLEYDLYLPSETVYKIYAEC